MMSEATEPFNLNVFYADIFDAFTDRDGDFCDFSSSAVEVALNDTYCAEMKV